MAGRRTPELWERLDNESSRAYEAFKVFLYMGPAERNVSGAWRIWAEAPDAKSAKPYFRDWSVDFAWQDRARAWDNHLQRLRETEIERAVKTEAKKQATQVEKLRFRLNELMAIGSEKAMTYLEEMEPSGMRMADVIQLIRLHLEYQDRLGASEGGKDEVEWTEDDDEFALGVMESIESGEAQDVLGGDAERPEEEVSPED